jgi:hypothetical protein
VPESEVAVEVLALGERKNAGGGDDAVAAEDKAPVVEHGLRLKQREDEFLGILAVQQDPGLNKCF